MKRYALLLIFAACHSQMASETISSREVATITASSAAVSLKLVPDPASPNVKLGPDEDYVMPQLSPSNPSPVYPRHLVALHLKSHTVVLRITFDERGLPSEIASSPIAASTENQYQREFESAAKEALAQWKCRPPRIRKFRPGPDADGDRKPDYRILHSQRVLKTFFDVSFAFEVINGVPVVKPVASK